MFDGVLVTKHFPFVTWSHQKGLSWLSPRGLVWELKDDYNFPLGINLVAKFGGAISVV